MVKFEADDVLVKKEGSLPKVLTIEHGTVRVSSIVPVILTNHLLSGAYRRLAMCLK